MGQVNIPVVNAGYLNVQGMQLAWASNTTLTMQAGQARDSSNVNDILLSALRLQGLRVERCITQQQLAVNGSHQWGGVTQQQRGRRLGLHAAQLLAEGLRQLCLASAFGTQDGDLHGGAGKAGGGVALSARLAQRSRCS